MGSIKFHYHKSLRDCDNSNSKWSFWFVFLIQAIFQLDTYELKNTYIHIADYYYHYYIMFLFYMVLSNRKYKISMFVSFRGQDVLFIMEYRVKGMQ